MTPTYKKASWAAQDWVSDVIPRLAYGAVTAGVFDGLDDR